MNCGNWPEVSKFMRCNNSLKIGCLASFIVLVVPSELCFPLLERSCATRIVRLHLLQDISNLSIQLRFGQHRPPDTLISDKIVSAFGSCNRTHVRCGCDIKYTTSTQPGSCYAPCEPVLTTVGSALLTSVVRARLLCHFPSLATFLRCVRRHKQTQCRGATCLSRLPNEEVGAPK